MPNVYLHKYLYDEVVRQNEDPNAFVNKVVAEAIQQLKSGNPGPKDE